MPKKKHSINVYIYETVKYLNKAIMEVKANE